MRREVVHHHYVSGVKLGQQLGSYPPDEVVLGDPLVRRREHDPAVASDRAEQVQFFPLFIGTLSRIGAALHPGMAAAHRQTQTRLVEEHQSPKRNPANLHREVRALERDVRPLTLQWPSTQSSTTNPCRESARFVLETWMRSGLARWRLISSVSSRAVASGHARSRARCPAT